METTTRTTKAPTVSTWHMPAANQGQTIEVSYGIDDDGYAWERTVDRSGPATSYRALGEPTDQWQPWNEVPGDDATV